MRLQRQRSQVTVEQQKKDLYHHVSISHAGVFYCMHAEVRHGNYMPVHLQDSRISTSQMHTIMKCKVTSITKLCTQKSET